MYICVCTQKLTYVNIKRHGLGAKVCARPNRVSIREPASYEHLRLSDLNNG